MTLGKALDCADEDCVDEGTLERDDELALLFTELLLIERLVIDELETLEDELETFELDELNTIMSDELDDFTLEFDERELDTACELEETTKLELVP